MASTGPTDRDAEVLVAPHLLLMSVRASPKPALRLLGTQRPPVGSREWLCTAAAIVGPAWRAAGGARAWVAAGAPAAPRCNAMENMVPRCWVVALKTIFLNRGRSKREEIQVEKLQPACNTTTPPAPALLCLLDARSAHWPAAPGPAQARARSGHPPGSMAQTLNPSDVSAVPVEYLDIVDEAWLRDKLPDDSGWQRFRRQAHGRTMRPSHALPPLLAQPRPCCPRLQPSHCQRASRPPPTTRRRRGRRPRCWAGPGSVGRTWD